MRQALLLNLVRALVRRTIKGLFVEDNANVTYLLRKA